MTLREQDGPKTPIYLAGCACRERRHVMLSDAECKVLRRALSAYAAACVLEGRKIEVDHKALLERLKG